jgi:hypothetical protein
MTTAPAPSVMTTADDCNGDNNDNNDNDNDSTNDSPLPRSKHETEGAIVFHLVLTSVPQQLHPASRATARGGFLFFCYLDTTPPPC